MQERDRSFNDDGLALVRAVHRRRAFTLVELLVVVAIILVLVALLMPVATKVRMAAMNLKCQSNLRQIGSGLIIYQSAYRHLMYTASDVRSGHSPGGNSHMRYGGIGLVNADLWTRLGMLHATGILRGDLGQIGVSRAFLCPIHDAYMPQDTYNGLKAATAGGGPLHADYSLRTIGAQDNYARLDSLQLGASYSPQAWTRRATIVSDRVDTSDFPAWMNVTPVLHTYFAQDGKDGYNFLFTDGSVDHLKLDSFYKAYPVNPTWVAPSSSNGDTREFFMNADKLFGIIP